ncbi:helix-turn-helix transcriptional regulator [Paenibacillus hexagrammi]|uniref:YafY family transcriptional regulator n=1 Tax=Paenibacillus hexagrammi TaxID=2908839 RepID=A0ABY3SQ41_9BACL|nr:YafY family protein [Paenibacillus sp. YPD9-1]UJF36123.1 YafY family transcriptional regulator [Paenibacillus sp. YPD9-1]
MKKIQRLVALMMAVNERMRFTVKEMAEQFGVSERTMHRDLQELCELGMPLYTEFGPHGGYRLLKKRILPPILFTEQEAAAMFFAVQSLQYYGSLPFEAESTAALDKFYHYLPEDSKIKIQEMKNRVVFWSPLRTQSPYCLEPILLAASQRRPIQIHYESKNETSSRLILPIGIYAHNGFWYAPSYCYRRSEVLLFRVDRIQSIDETITAPDSTPDHIKELTLKDWFEHSDSRIHPEPDLQLRILFTPYGVRLYERSTVFPGKLDINEDGSGVLTAAMHTCNIPHYGTFMLSFGSDAHVQEPPELVVWLQEQVNRLTGVYLQDKEFT